MAMAELLGVQFDMQLLLKLGVSVAAVLLATLAYRFYNSRNAREDNLRVNNEKELRKKACRNCNPPRRSLREDADDEVKQPVVLHSDSTTEANQGQQSDDASDVNQYDITTEKIPSRQATGNLSTLNLPDPTEKSSAGATGRRSPCFLQKLEGSVGVGRELRQDLEHLGSFSSFLSKAEIKVEDANVVLEGTGDQIARGKIYDYYVESSSQSVVNQFERNSDSEELGSRSGTLSDSPASLSPIVMRDLVFPESPATEEASSRKGQNPRPALLRKESYLSAAEHAHLAFSFPTSRTSDEMTTAAYKGLNEQLHLDNFASFLGPPANVADPEALKSKVDLGNCVETLCLAKKRGHDAAQQAALSVMSDNYLQVLRDPNIYGRLMADEREHIRKQRMRGRKFVMVADMDPQDWASGTAKQKTTSSAVYCYDDYKDTWHTVCPIPQEAVSKACAMCTMDNYLFVAVGCQGADREAAPSKRVLCFNPLTSIWKEISPMNEARPRCKLAALDGFVYAIGGECLSSVERYDPRSDRWAFVAPLPNDTFAVAHHISVCDGELFVSGGTLRYLLLRYNPKTDTWRSSVSIGSKDRTVDMVAVGRFLYRFDVNPLLGISVHRYHTVAKLWYECSSRRILRCPAFQCVAVNGTIFCISRQFTMRFEADDVLPAFAEEEDFSVISAARGILVPFVLAMPDKKLRQTSV